MTDQGTTVDDLLPWVRAQILQEEEEALNWLCAARRNGKATARKRLLQCAATSAVLDLHDRMSIRPGHPMFNDAHLTTESMVICRSCEPEKMFRRTHSWPCRTVKAVALAYQHNPGYQERWRP